MKKQKDDGLWWKILIVLTFFISISCLVILLNESKVIPEYEYETLIIELNNTNKAIQDGVIVDYLCDEGVHVWISQLHKYGYFSTWDKDHRIKEEFKGINGKCMIKIRKVVDKVTGEVLQDG